MNGTNILSILKSLKDLPGDDTQNLSLVMDGSRFQLYHGAGQLGDDLTLADLRMLSGISIQKGIVQLVDISQLVFAGAVKSTDSRLKVEDDLAKCFLHLVKELKFQKVPMEVAV